MKKIMHILVFVLLMISLSACGKSSEPEITPTEVVSMDAIHTAVVLTLTAEAASFSPTPQPTSTTTLTPTPVPSQTPVQKSATLVSLNPVVTTSNNTANGCNDSVYVSDVTIPDGTTLAAGEAFTKTWSLKNTGSCNWEADYKLVFISGESMGANDTVIGTVVNTGFSGSVSVKMVAPSTDGTYYSYWRLADKAGNRFGGQVYVMIKVSGNAGTTTVTPTVTKTGAAKSSTSTLTGVPSTSTQTLTSAPSTATQTVTETPN
ncbi:MAG: hypothetical protein JEZ00_15435 [Anaerolineaceae bacterium]|nr:hypothetical protein [Anaerolineaceae bacterium]